MERRALPRCHKATRMGVDENTPDSGFVPIGAFFLFGSIHGRVCRRHALLMPGTPLDRSWTLNTRQAMLSSNLWARGTGFGFVALSILLACRVRWLVPASLLGMGSGDDDYRDQYGRPI